MATLFDKAKRVLMVGATAGVATASLVGAFAAEGTSAASYSRTIKRCT